MREYLAIPAWRTPPTPLAAWVAGLTEAAGPVAVRPDPPSAFWLEVAPLRLRGFALIEEGHASAINFELHDPDPDPATRAIEAAALALGWEIHADDEDDPDDDD